MDYATDNGTSRLVAQQLVMVCMKDLTGYPQPCRRENNFATTHEPNNNDDDDDGADDGDPY